MIQIRPNRLEVSDRFPMLGFTVRTDGNVRRFEIAIGTSPDLFGPEGKSHRSRMNFYSTRATGPIAIDRGEAVYVLPTEVLARFIGQQKLYYGLATIGNGNGSAAPEVATMPGTGSPYINISTLTGRSMQRVRMLPSRQRVNANYGKAGYELDWAGDAMMPGMQMAPAPKAGVTMPANGTAGSTPAHYDDGYGPLPTPPPAAKPEMNAQAKSLADDDDSQDESHGIDGPIPDVESTTQALSRPLDMSPEYPGASRFVPAYSGNFRAVSGDRAIRRIVIHITDGQPKLNGTVAWFQDRSAQVSAHYIVGQDGEIVQMVRHNDVAWHASSANGDSIGIEHVARAAHEWDKKLGHADPGMMPTDAQYCASAALVNWLCTQFNLPMDRTHVLGHSEADPRTTHTDCPNAVWDWDYYMGMVASGNCAPRSASASSLSSWSAALDDNQNFDENWNDVEVLGQPDNLSCWATAAAMVVGWRDKMSLDIDTLKKIFNDQTGNVAQAGLYPKDNQKLADMLGLVAEPPQSYSVDGFRRMLENYGPTWAGLTTGGFSANQPWSHAVVVTGIYGDGTPANTFVRITDPWGRMPGMSTAPGYHNPSPGQGGRYTQSYQDFTQEYEARVTTEGNNVNLQLMHAADTGGRTIGTGATQAFSLATLDSVGMGKKRHKTMGHHAQHHNDKAPANIRAASLGDDDQDDAHGIDGPIPDDSVAAQAFALSSEYPQATRFEPAASGNFHAVASPRAIQRIVIHITDGGAKIGGTIEHFKNPASKVSAHYIVGQDGEVVQMVKNNDIAWHANSANGDSIGIEHVARARHALDKQLGHADPGLMPTPLQYCASATLVNWLCDQLSIPVDRTHILGHAEADRKTSHTGCPNAVWDWDYYMGMVTTLTCDNPPAQSESLSVRLPAPPRKLPTGRTMAGTSARAIANMPLQTMSGAMGNVTWDLDQFSGIKNSEAGMTSLQSAETIDLSNWPYCDHANGSRASAWFSVDWKFFGQAIGEVRITPTGSQPGAQPLHVEARIEDAPNRDSSTSSLLVRFTYQFSTQGGPAVMAMTELKLYSDGSIDQKSDWTSRAA